ncbi:tRNA 2-selenouridine(34) synthase MnmH [Sulfitobacter sp. F26169L]|uniref:tRNA 2-selenouridine(34) synthase MnmH n=1 Tax=Sulfitobacter sp. F26169L TaxID=2996015 RepID=UPI0022608ABA|nr:tRNA 2-selenouridine(34) synthase MnmH [Sulfitobacter sp. F26169L]MCX7564730.1 tRNA 2-selenouridine(34) synthase MnmH [Sulfitobacter sp. F26169L]
MIRHTLTSLNSIAAIGADTIIDVRAPSEFAEDHVPEAVNLPVLSDAERSRVGTIYTRQSAFLARKTGAALVAANAARHLQGPLAQMGGDWQPLIYCWRGGQRSGAFATILDQVGWRVHLIEDGYRSYRRQVNKMLYDTPLPHRIMLVDGGTGTAKTALLHHLRGEGAQILDLEGLAGHRGSLFGALDVAQPSQKMFETRLAAALRSLDPTRLTWVEGESSKVGARVIPPVVWAAMHRAPRIEVSAPVGARAAFLSTAYADLTQDTDALIALIDQLRGYHPAEVIADWQALARADNWQALAAQLMIHHYDPRYTKSQARAAEKPQQVVLGDLTADTLAQTARDLIARFN